MGSLWNCAAGVALCGMLTATSSAAALAGPTLSIEGVCPGGLTVGWSGATPDRWAGLCFAFNTGMFVLPGPPCDGTVMGLGTSGLRLVRAFETGPNGAGQFVVRVRRPGCGGYAQLLVVEGRPCETSNVVQLPR